jgi:hypothetical protein
VSSWDDLRLQVTPGSGVVARSAAALLVVPTVGEHHQPVLEQLVSLVRNARPDSGRTLARKLAGVIASSEPDEVPDLALFAGLGGDGVAVLVLGEAEVAADTSDGRVLLSGRDSLTWVDKVLRAPTHVVVGLPGQPAPSSMPLTDLVEGVVPGGGALLESRTAGSSKGTAGASKGKAVAAVPSPTGALTDPMPAASAEPQEHPDDVPPPRNEDFQVEPLGDPEPEQRAPLPVEPEGAATASDASHTDLVEGVYCKRGHFTDPDSQFCIVCGIALSETKIKRKGVRPELGFLVFDDGSVFHLDHDYVLGRQPEVDDEVKAGTVRGLRLDDSGGTVSRAHAIVRLTGWNVTIADRKSQNGTLVAAKGSEQFVPVSRDQPVTLVPGSRIQLGQRTLVYESQRGADR